MALGERILAELGEDRTTDTLTRWFVHHTAALMDEADHARATGDPDAEIRGGEARTAILQLWEHRSAWPHGWPPPRTLNIVRLLDDLPDFEDPIWQTTGALSRLQDLHHHILGVLTDLAARNGTSLEQGWLRAFGDHLTREEVMLLSRAAGVPQRLDKLVRTRETTMSNLRRRLMDEQADEEIADVEDDVTRPNTGEHVAPVAGADDWNEHPLVRLADIYRDSVIDLLRRANDGAGGGGVSTD
ncbi:hypothetical protein MRU69_10400 [Kocuria flava]|uniref:hypothetical protein n=1 Tax=Kocuria flava TaxID=446860 RepID=UPI001FF5447A|nr:hypothetical protein [Kocuria flava]MCJ8505267.1 hypothetical protein [Kocuria flava]